MPLLQGLLIDEGRSELQQAFIQERLNRRMRTNQLNNLLVDAASAYWKWVYAFYATQVYEEAYTTAEQRRRDIVISFSVGDLPAVDTLEALIVVQSRQFKWQEAQVLLANASMELSYYLWDSPERPFAFNPDLQPTQLPSPQAEPVFTNINLSNHPVVAMYTDKFEQYEVERRWKAEQLKPQLDLEYQFLGNQLNFSGGENLNFPGLLQQNYKWGVRLRFPLFLRKERAGVQLTEVKLAETSLEQNAKRQDIQNKITKFEQQLANNFQQIQLYQNMVENYRSLLAAELEKFRIGESSVFLVNAREQKLFETQITLLKLQSAYHTQLAGLAWARGELEGGF